MRKVEEIVDIIHSMKSWEQKESILRNWAEEIIDECAELADDMDEYNLSLEIKDLKEEL